MQVLQFYSMKTTAATDPQFFAVDYAYTQNIDQLKLKISWWKNMLGWLYYRIGTRWLLSRMTPQRDKARKDLEAQEA